MINYDYSSLPEHMQGAAKRYVEQGIPPGGFLTAVLSNNLVDAFGRADSTNAACLKDYINWLYWDIPSSCWGSSA
ncbi:hypothetical protein LCGC14_3169250, partial [marine sediment metagenome]